MNKQELLKKWSEPSVIGTDGHVRLVDVMGDDAAVVQMARTSYGKGTTTQRDDRGLIRYLMRHNHTTPFEGCEIKLHVRVPMDIWRQWIRHRTASVNEYSTRYSEAIDNQNFTHLDEWRVQSTSNKQGSAGLLRTALHKKQCMCLPHKNLEEMVSQWSWEKFAEEYRNNPQVHAFIDAQLVDHYPEGATAEDVWRDRKAAELTHLEREASRACQKVYHTALDAGIAREQARKNLQLSTYTEAYWKIDLHNLLHFLRLRLHPHAQQEIREFSWAIAAIVEDWVPNVWEAFVDYRLESVSFSRMEMEALKRFLAMATINQYDFDPANEEEGDCDMVNLPNLRDEYRAMWLESIGSKRERIEFWNKIKA